MPFIDWGGDIGPFQVAIFLTVVALFLILTWTENYGECHKDPAHSTKGNTSGFADMVHSIQSSVKVVSEHPVIFCLGMSQAFFEGAVYTFGECMLEVSSAPECGDVLR